MTSVNNNPLISMQKKEDLLEQLAQFDFGRYLLQNQGINGYWTHYMLTHPWFGRNTKKNNRGDSFTELESFILDRAPTLLATQQRFEFFLKENQKQVANGKTLACIPSGMMGELLYLNYDNIDQINLIGIDYDLNTFKDAEWLAKQKGLSQFVKFIHQDAWQMDFSETFDLISSNGLNIYESDNQKVEELYRRFYKALKPGGQLVTSILTYPPGMSHFCEWDFSKINKDDLLLQKIVFVDIIAAKWQCYRSTVETKNQLEHIGFSQVHFLYDEAKLFPTVLAYKT
jgi:SAM-dependent methyltransferase